MCQTLSSALVIPRNLSWCVGQGIIGSDCLQLLNTGQDFSPRNQRGVSVSLLRGPTKKSKVLFCPPSSFYESQSPFRCEFRMFSSCWQWPSVRKLNDRFILLKIHPFISALSESLGRPGTLGRYWG